MGIDSRFSQNKRLLLLLTGIAILLIGLLLVLLAAFKVSSLESFGLAIGTWLMASGTVVLIGAWLYKKWAEPKQLSDGKKAQDDETSRMAIIAFLIAIGVGLLAILIYALATPDVSKFVPEFVSTTSVGVMVAGASLFVGGLLGFLFGIPRTLQQDSLQAEESEGSDEGEDQEKDENTSKKSKRKGQTYGVNTNLEQISDWLTKILVGVGLTQITVMPGKLWALSGSLAVGLGTEASNTVFVLAIMIYYSICGFMLGYLWTRLYLAGAFRRADTEVAQLKEQTGNIEAELKKHRQSVESDATALNLANDQLNIDTPNIYLKELTEALQTASPRTRSTIYNLSRAQRNDNWRSYKPRMERTIPLFDALCQTDPNDPKDHRNYGQHGYALKDKIEPDFDQALAKFDKAIALRGPWEDQGYLLYEFNRALTRIMVDQKQPGGESSPDNKNLILTDLKAAASQKYIQTIIGDMIEAKTLIGPWLNDNNLTRNDIFP